MKPIIPNALFASGILAGCYVAYVNYPWWKAGYFMATEYKWFGWVLGSLVTIFVAFILAGIGRWIASIIGDHSDQIWHRRWSAQMVSMRSGDGVSGRVSGGLFMIHGTIGSRQFYSYYTENSDGSFQPHTWTPDSDTAVYEEGRKDGEVIQFGMKFDHPWVEWFGYTGDRVRMEFHIPKGSLKQSFSIE